VERSPSAPFALFDLDGRVAIVTGASSGLGAHVARVLAAAGARTALVARRRERLTALADELAGLALPCDIGSPADLGQVVPQVADALGPPEILVNAAGNYFSDERAASEPIESIQQTLNVNLVAAFRLSQDVFPHMVSLGRGAIVNISSIQGLVAVPGIPHTSYAASKLGLSGLSRELAVQWARHAIRINTIAPGFFRSEITDPLYESERGNAWLRRNTPLPYDGTVYDFAGPVLWLVSDAGRYVTGQTIVVDGGWTAK
jgi:NAD(P)-dependent dehydrogenase (short-subunit alcohol dehydrogenase family)